MKTEKELQEDILAIMAKIREQSPELLKYISEMPFAISYNSGAGIAIESLSDYYNSLLNVSEKYNREQLEMGNEK